MHYWLTDLAWRVVWAFISRWQRFPCDHTGGEQKALALSGAARSDLPEHGRSHCCQPSASYTGVQSPATALLRAGTASARPVRAGGHLQAAPRTSKSFLSFPSAFLLELWHCVLQRSPVIAALLEGQASCVSRWPSQTLIAFVTRLGRFNFADPQGFLHFPYRNTSFASFLQL